MWTAENRARFAEEGILGVNVMASPGAGKTSVILATAARLPADARPGVIEGDLASSIDTEKMLAAGIPATQINTGGNCHLDAPMIRAAPPITASTIKRCAACGFEGPAAELERRTTCPACDALWG